MSSNIVAFAKATAFQRGVCSILANLLTQSTDLADLREMFVKWDINQDGFISIQELNANMQEVTNFF